LYKLRKQKLFNKTTKQFYDLFHLHHIHHNNNKICTKQTRFTCYKYKYFN